MDYIELMKTQLADFSAGRWDEYEGRLAEDATYEEIASQTSAKGKAAYVEAVKRWKQAFPDVVANVKDAFTAGDRVAAEVEWTGTHTGPLEGPFGTIAPTNERGSVKAMLVSRIADGKIAETHNYFDVLTVLTQIGVVPGIGAPAQAEQAEEGAAAEPAPPHP